MNVSRGEMSWNPKPTSYAQYRQFAEQVAADTKGDGSSLDALASKNFEVRPAEAHKRIIEVELHKTLLCIATTMAADATFYTRRVPVHFRPLVCVCVVLTLHEGGPHERHYERAPP